MFGTFNMHIPPRLVTSSLGFIFALVFILFSAALTSAQACGNPPDPWGNASGYAAWCSCMGGSYNWSTTACEGATGPSRDSNRGSDSGDYSTPRGTGWYCVAKAGNGAWGWGEFWQKSGAVSRAFKYCRQGANGTQCHLSWCAQNSGITKKTSRKPKWLARKSPKKKRRGSALSCNTCYRKMVNDIKSGRNSGRYKSYVNQAMSGYYNCKRKSDNHCTRGDILYRSLYNGCRGYNSNRTYKSCVTRIMNAH